MLGALFNQPKCVPSEYYPLKAGRQISWILPDSHFFLAKMVFRNRPHHVRRYGRSCNYSQRNFDKSLWKKRHEKSRYSKATTSHSAKHMRLRFICRLTFFLLDSAQNYTFKTYWDCEFDCAQSRDLWKKKQKPNHNVQIGNSIWFALVAVRNVLADWNPKAKSKLKQYYHDGKHLIDKLRERITMRKSDKIHCLSWWRTRNKKLEQMVWFASDDIW